MYSSTTHTKDLVVSTLLQIGGRVLEVTADGEIIRLWDAASKMPELEPVDNETIVSQFIAKIRSSIEHKRTEAFEHSIVYGDTISKFKIRVLGAAYPDQSGYAYVVIEFLSAKRVGKVSEDYWKLALDTAGDGMWDVHVPERTMVFSDRWHKHFEYSQKDVASTDKWLSLIHPDDREGVIKSGDDHLAGKTQEYFAEFRIRCLNGDYKWILSKGMVVARTSEGKALRFLGTHTDITALKAAEEKYYSTAQMLSKLINNLRDGILVTDEHKKIMFANQMFCDIYNLSEHPSALIGMDVYKSIAARMPFYKDPDHFYTRTVEVLNRQEVVLGEEWEMNNGKVIGRDHIPLTLGKDSKGGIWKLRDITIQKNAEKQLADLRVFYEHILNNIGADIVVFDPQQRYIFINPTAVKNKELRGWMIGKTDEDYRLLRNKPLEFSRRRQEIFQEALSQRKNIEWEEMLVNREGEPEYHLRYHMPVFDEKGNHKMSIGYGMNITDRVKAQQELKTSRDTFASAFRDSGIGMALLSHEGMWLDANSVMCAITGYTCEELQQLSLTDITHRDDVDADRPFMESMLKREISTYNTEKHFVSKAGRKVLVSLTMSLVWSVEGLPKFFIVQAIDITEKKEMEQELLAKNAELETTKQNLLNKVNQLEDLSHIIAHNLRGPAGNIKMLTETLLEQQALKASGDDSQPEVFTTDEALLLIHDSSMSLMESLATLMQITEIKLNKEIPRDNCDVSTIVNDICNQLHSVIHEKHAIVRKRLEVSHVSYPKAYLESILYNLISNALKYTIVGLIPEIDICTDAHEGRVVLSVKDNGLGIDMERYADRLFKLNQVFHEGFESKGIGLYITKTTVESLGGKIDVKSAPNEGCEFIVTL